MATALLGDQIDIHCGGVDNIFPHHEAGIAQSEGVTEKKFVRYWLHCAHLLVDGQKMAKSLGNFYTVPDVLAKGYTGRELRYALMRVHYRVPLNFTWEGMNEARESLGRIDEWLERLQKMVGTPRRGVRSAQRADPTSQFEEALDDDLNISAALGFLFESIRETNRAMDQNKMEAATANTWLKWWARVNNILALEPEQETVSVVVSASGVEGKAAVGSGQVTIEEALPPEIAKLANARAQARLAKDWRKSDELRDELSARGWEARDTKDGQKITRRAG